MSDSAVKKSWQRRLKVLETTVPKRKFRFHFHPKNGAMRRMNDFLAKVSARSEEILEAISDESDEFCDLDDPFGDSAAFRAGRILNNAKSKCFRNLRGYLRVLDYKSKQVITSDPCTFVEFCEFIGMLEASKAECAKKRRWHTQLATLPKFKGRKFVAFKMIGTVPLSSALPP